MQKSGIDLTQDIPTPPFWGSRILPIAVDTLIPYINLNRLYYFHWGFKPDTKKEAEAVFTELVTAEKKKSMLEPRTVYGYFPCQSDKNSLIIYSSSLKRKELCRFTFPRQNSKENLCLSDFFQPLSSQMFDLIAFQIVAIFHKISDFTKTLFQKNEYKKYLFWHGFNVELVSALAAMVHEHIRTELKLPKNQGVRFSLGYSACPNLEDQQKILILLDAKRIGVSLSETFQLIPEETTSAMILHHPQSKLFDV